MRIPTLTLLLLFLASSLFAQGDQYYVQIAVYNKKVSPAHFPGLVKDLCYSNDSNDFHRYFVGAYDKAKAESEMKRAEQMGYKASLMHSDEFDTRCCNNVPVPKLMVPNLQSIFFDFDKYNLRPASKTELNKLVKVLKNNPAFTAKLMAHTDAKGSNSYNERLSMNRANAAKQYLISRGIARSRIQTETFGENDPIAKNELSNGQDTEEGRQFNRRVVLQVLDGDGAPLNEIVDPIEVPETLKSN